MKNKRNMIILIVAFCILAIVVGSLVIINKEKRKEKSEESTNSLESNQVDKSIINYLKLSSLPEEYFGYFYQEDKYNNSSIDNNIKIYMAIRKVLSNQKDINYSKKIEIKEADVTDALKELFGSDVTYKHESLEGNTCSYTNFKYNKSKKMYIQEPDGCFESNTDTILSEIIDKKTTDKKIEIYEKIGYVEISYNTQNKKISYNIYKDIAKKNKIATIDEYSISSVKDSLSTYKYTFIKENNNYYLNSVELVK